jgi:hypothetical protein
VPTVPRFNAGTAGAQKGDEKKRFRSEIEFPYSDLDGAVDIADMIPQEGRIIVRT